MTAGLSVAEILDLPALVPLWPTVGRALGLAESTTYQLAAENRLPSDLEVIRLGRRRVVRTVDLHRFLGLVPGNSESAAAVTATPSSERPTPTA
ncbi:helix-turn-helix domain-containing protein [Streptomyces anulatus]|uniref:helix-turn-helix domain-containing protein n=1 Tax=Streptomyces anulatus TaxID=1892 RepID=UPI001C5DBF75|nr:helix-turn-helix domain-containing protein [Streptomyces anulatus]QYA94041.1 helix-turn-helix domain-containing protein [Streptomyces anulatus]